VLRMKGISMERVTHCSALAIEPVEVEAER
jgi:hypothetical protein